MEPIAVSVMSELDLVKQGRRCGGCGTTNVPAETIVIDWRPELLCERCVANHDWSDWTFDPVLNVYRRK
jgi:hypothetical protein